MTLSSRELSLKHAPSDAIELIDHFGDGLRVPLSVALELLDGLRKNLHILDPTGLNVIICDIQMLPDVDKLLNDHGDGILIRACHI